jgi:hypothetical protein
MLRGLFVFIFLSTLFSGGIVAQDNLYKKYPEESKPGHVKIIQDSRVDSIIYRHIQHNQSLEGSDGYRVHIFFDAGNQSLNRANQAARRYQMLFPDDTAYISFSEPYYRVRVGDFRTRMDAEGHLQKISAEYPNAFIIKDKINPPRLD